MIVTIDGPMASGKSSLARKLALQLKWSYLYSGLLYRAIAYIVALRYGYTTKTCESICDTDIRDICHRIQYHYEIHTIYITIDELSFDEQFLKSAELDKLSSHISKNVYIREQMVHVQRVFAHNRNIIADGRDCGTVVFPQAELKLFLTADESIRAERWQKDQAKRGIFFSIDESLQAVRSRDTRDQERLISPLIPASDALIIDTSNYTFDEVFEIIFAHICNKIISF